LSTVGYALIESPSLALLVKTEGCYHPAIVGLVVGYTSEPDSVVLPVVDSLHAELAVVAQIRLAVVALDLEVLVAARLACRLAFALHR
jgi:hypothetical protein